MLDLTKGWTVRAVAGPALDVLGTRSLPAEVPGLVHLDLLRAGLIPDPFDGDNESVLQWIGRSTWEYSCDLEIDLGIADRHDLVCEGLDTVATVLVNDIVVARTVNQHRRYRWQVGHLLVTGANRLVVRFDSALDYAERMEAILGERPHANHHPYNAVRKSACTFGWDWGIDIVSAGIWRPMRLESWSGCHLTSLTVVPDVVDGVPRLRVLGEAASTVTSPARLDVTVAGARSSVALPSGSGLIDHVLDVPEAELWWPRGFGEQPLYDVNLQVVDAERTRSYSVRTGFRCVAVDTRPDALGSAFRVSINGEPLQVRGVNWIPDDALITRVDEARLRERFADAIEANVTLLRVWGGGVYESDEFYALCDELGLLVWQDFLFACAAYSEEEPLRGEIEAEAIDAIHRLDPHPSLVVWNGNNENIWGYVDWGWRARLDGTSWGDNYYRSLLPRLVADHDGTRFYSAGSPYSFEDYLHPNDPAHGTCHIWDVWNTRDYTAYAEYRPRFVSEFGFQGPPAWRTLTSVVHDEPLDPFGSHMLVHQKAVDGNLKLQRGYTPHFDEPTTIEDWHFTTQLNQAHAIGFGIDHFRSCLEENDGVILWQLNDNWPVISWAAVDYLGYRKPMWYTLRRSFAPIRVLLHRAGGGLELVALNDGPAPLRRSVRVRRCDLDGRTLAETVVEVDARPRSGARYSLEDLADVGDAAREVLIADGDGLERAVYHCAEVREQELDDPLYRLAVEQSGTTVTVTLEALVLLRDVWFAVDSLGRRARASDGIVTLLPGESAVVTIDGVEGSVDEERLRHLLWSANRLKASARSSHAAARTLDAGEHSCGGVA